MPIKRGRKSLFTSDKIKEIAINAAELGHTDEEIATIIGIEKRTLERWRLLNSEFCRSLKEAKMKSNTEVEASLRKRAIGYDYTEEVLTKDGEIIELRKHLPPETSACNSWLNNRDPARWRDRRVVQANINHNINWMDFLRQCEKEGNGTDKNRIAGIVAETERVSG